MARGKPILFLALRIALSVTLVGLVLTRVDLSGAGDLLSTVKVGFLALALLLIVLERALLAYKWNVLLAVKGMSVSFWRAFTIYYMGTFVTTVLPSTVSGDVFRAVSLYRYNANASESASSVLVEKVLALLSLFVAAVVGWLLWSGGSMLEYILYVAAVVGSGILVLGILANRSLARVASGCIGRINRGYERKLAGFYSAFWGYARHRRVLLYVFGLSLIFQVMRVLATYSVGLALNQELSIVYYFVVVPLTIAVVMLPISIGGIGVREGVFVYLFSQAGMAPVDALALSFLIYLITIVSALPGGIMYMLAGSAARPKPQSGPPSH